MSGNFSHSKVTMRRSNTDPYMRELVLKTIQDNWANGQPFQVGEILASFKAGPKPPKNLGLNTVVALLRRNIVQVVPGTAGRNKHYRIVDATKLKALTVPSTRSGLPVRSPTRTSTAVGMLQHLVKEVGFLRTRIEQLAQAWGA